ncbi:reverse transcriptase domain-containing protein [Tanacetum coccineum]
MVADFVINNVWTWPQAWLAKAPILNLIPAPNLDENTMDCVRWRDANGVFSDFSVSRAWEAFRPRGNEVNCLKTQDKLRQWDVGINTDLNLLRCSLCNTQSDSHAHLFFECPYSSKVWKLVRHLADMEYSARFFLILLLIFSLWKTRERLEAFLMVVQAGLRLIGFSAHSIVLKRFRFQEDPKVSHLEAVKKIFRMESREMLLSIHHGLKMLLDIISKMNRKLEDEKIKINDKEKGKVNYL